MKATWMAFLGIAVFLSGCACIEKPKKQKVAKDVFSVEVEEFNLTDAKVQEDKDAGGGKVVVLQDMTGKAAATIKLSKGSYEITVYALGPSSDEDAFYVTIGESAQERRWPQKPGELLPTLDVVNFTQKADGPCNILLTFAESNVQLDRVQFKHVP